MFKSFHHTPHRGAATVEMAMILPIAFLICFGIMEFARLIADRGLLDNATREAARVAAVSTTSRTTSDIQAIATGYFNGQSSAPDVTVLVYQADPTTGQNVGAWTAAGRGDCIGVEATAKHTFVLPLFGLFPNTVTLHAKSVVYSEGN